MSEERVLLLLRSMGTGTILTLLGQPEGARDPDLPEAAREAVVAAVVSEAAGFAEPGSAGAAAALGASLAQVATLSPGERHLLSEVPGRIADER